MQIWTEWELEVTAWSVPVPIREAFKLGKYESVKVEVENELK